MASFYVYLISSLPALAFGAKPPFSVAEFLKRCAELICAEDVDVLKEAAEGAGSTVGAAQPTLAHWRLFDAQLRNELARARAAHHHRDPAPYLKPGVEQDIALAQTAASALRIPAPLDAELSLDRERWKFLEAAAIGHYFDLDFLIVYILQLTILERWERIRGADKARLLEEVLTTDARTG